MTQAIYCKLLINKDLECFENLPDLIETSRNMETSLPLTALKGKEDLASTVQVTVPLRMNHSRHCSLPVSW